MTHPRVDPAAALRIWAVETDVAGRTIRIPPLPSADWLPVLATEDPLALRDLVDGVPSFADDLMEGRVTAQEIRSGYEVLIEAACGRSPRAVYVIVGSAWARWDVIGSDMARVGIRWDSIPIAAALDAIYGSVMRHLDEKGIGEFTRLVMQGERPPQPARRRQRPGRGPSPAIVAPFGSIRTKSQPPRPPAPSDAPPG